MKNVEGKVIIITGTSSGIGEAAAKVLAENGAKVVLSVQREKRIENLGALAQKKFGKVDAVFANVGTMPLAVQSFLDEYDLSGKTIYLCVTHGGSGIGGIDREIARAEPNATVSRNTLALSRRDTLKSEKRITDWAESF